MPELTSEQVRNMTSEQIAAHLRRAALFQKENRAITWEHGTDLVNIVAIHGDILANALDNEYSAKAERPLNPPGHP